MTFESEKVKNAVKESCEEGSGSDVAADWRRFDAISGYRVFIALFICGDEEPEYVHEMRVGEEITGSDGRRSALKDGMKSLLVELFAR